MRISDCGLRNGERWPRGTSHGSTNSPQANHEPGEKAQWPNEPTAPQVKGLNWDAMRVASCGAGLVAGRDVARCVREMPEADVVSSALPGDGRPLLGRGRGA